MLSLAVTGSGSTKFLTLLLEESRGKSERVVAFVAPYAICWQKRESTRPGQLGPGPSAFCYCVRFSGWDRTRGKETHEEITTRLHPPSPPPPRTGSWSFDRGENEVSPTLGSSRRRSLLSSFFPLSSPLLFLGLPF